MECTQKSSAHCKRPLGCPGENFTLASGIMPPVNVKAFLPEASSQRGFLPKVGASFSKKRPGFAWVKAKFWAVTVT